MHGVHKAYQDNDCILECIFNQGAWEWQPHDVNVHKQHIMQEGYLQTESKSPAAALIPVYGRI